MILIIALITTYIQLFIFLFLWVVNGLPDNKQLSPQLLPVPRWKCSLLPLIHVGERNEDEAPRRWWQR